MTKFVARAFLRLNGWKVEGQRPVSRKYVLIAAPHTSNWDLPYVLAFAAVFDMKISWMAKHTIFAWPMGWLFRRLGGIPVRRHQRNNLVQQMAQEFEKRDALALVIPPEGTRSYVPYWKSGFYQIALAAQVPIVMSYLDFPTKRGGMSPELILTGDVSADMDEIRGFYAGMVGKHADLGGEIRLKEEM